MYRIWKASLASLRQRGREQVHGIASMPSWLAGFLTDWSQGKDYCNYLSKEAELI